jgi:hypothetical protein
MMPKEGVKTLFQYSPNCAIINPIWSPRRDNICVSKKYPRSFQKCRILIKETKWKQLQGYTQSRAQS